MSVEDDWCETDALVVASGGCVVELLFADLVIVQVFGDLCAGACVAGCWAMAGSDRQVTNVWNRVCSVGDVNVNRARLAPCASPSKSGRVRRRCGWRLASCFEKDVRDRVGSEIAVRMDIQPRGHRSRLHCLREEAESQSKMGEAAQATSKSGLHL